MLGEVLDEVLGEELGEELREELLGAYNYVYQSVIGMLDGVASWVHNISMNSQAYKRYTTV